MSAGPQQSAADPLGSIVESALARLRSGERPVAEDYVALHPHLAAEIREAFSALVILEGLGGSSIDRTGDVTPRSSSEIVAVDRGRELGDYRLVRLVGRGGMGAVYEAEQVSLNRRVALKLLPAEVTHDPDRVARFAREARAAGRLHHTNIVPVFGLGHHHGTHFYIMQLIRGLGLDAVIDELRRSRANGPGAAATGPRPGAGAGRMGPDPSGGGSDRVPDAPTLAASLVGGRFEGSAAPEDEETGPPPPASPSDRGNPPEMGSAVDPSAVSSLVEMGARYWDGVARIGRQAAEALDCAHGQGVLHRDIKPSNLLLDLRGTVWVTDFGLAKASDEEGLSRSNDVVGTIRYMAPERFEGRADARSDLYALGLTLYEMLVLRPAFDAREHGALVRQVTQSEPAPLLRLDPTIPRDLVTIVQKAIAREPERRYESAGDLADDLGRFLERRPILARRSSTLGRLRLWCSRNKTLAAASLFAIAMTILVAAVSMVAAWTYYRQRNAGREQLFAALVERARAGRHSHGVGRRFESERALAKAAVIGRDLRLSVRQREELRDETIACLALDDVEPSGLVLQKPPGATDLALSPSMDRYAVGRPDGSVTVRRVVDATELARLETRFLVDVAAHTRRILVFGPGGRHLATYRAPDRGVTVWDVDQGAAVLELRGPIEAGMIAFSPDGRAFAAAGPDGKIGMYGLDRNRTARTWEAMPHPKALAIAPDSGRLAVVGDGRVQIYRLPAATLELEWKSECLNVTDGDMRVRWSPDGRYLVANHGNLELDLWDTRSGSERRTFGPIKRGYASFDFHPSGRLLATNSVENRLELWDLQSMGPPSLSLPSTYNEIRFAGDGRIALGEGGGLALHRVEPSPALRTLAQSRKLSLGWARAAVRGDSGLAAVCTRKEVILIDMAAGREVASLRMVDVLHLRFVEDGDLLTYTPGGLLRWPIRVGTDPVIGPPRALPREVRVQRAYQFGTDRTGRVYAIADGSGVYLNVEGRPSRLGDMERVRYVAVSPDGRWLAIGQELGGGAVVLALPDGARHDLGGNGDATVAFSPDGRWLMANGEECRIWEVGTWRLACRIDGRGYAFSPDGRALALVDPDRVICLADVPSGRILARLDHPDPPSVQDLAFASGGAELLVVNHEGDVLQVWDLRTIRRRLAGLGLDWDAPPYPPVAPDAPARPAWEAVAIDYGPTGDHVARYSEDPEPRIRRLTTDLRERPDDVEARHERGWLLFGRDRIEEALADFDAGLRLRPWDAHLRSLRGWALIRLDRLEDGLGELEGVARSNPDELRRGDKDLLFDCDRKAWRLLIHFPKSPRDVDLAVRLARLDLDVFPTEPHFLETMGVVHYRRRSPAAAIAALEKALAAEPEGDRSAPRLYFLAMARHVAGQTAEARRAFDRAAREKDPEDPVDKEDLKLIRAEAEAVMARPADVRPEKVLAP
jgi:serine/threonine protein kinase/WD40 repeat protein/tetratricopeptide (TPR) repeat protein